MAQRTSQELKEIRARRRARRLAKAESNAVDGTTGNGRSGKGGGEKRRKSKDSPRNDDKKIEDAKTIGVIVQPTNAANSASVNAEREKPEPTAPKPPAPAAVKPPSPPKPKINPPAPIAQMQKRHYGVMFSFLLFVVLPAAFVYWYLENRAADQFSSTVGFSVRKEETSSPTDVLGGLTGLSIGSSTDTDILYEFIQSHQLIATVDEKLDLGAIYSIPVNDPVFAFDADKPLEELVDYWARMVKVYYDAGTGLIEIRVLAFTAEDAQTIANEIFSQSSNLINELSDIARADTTRYTERELEIAVSRLKEARQAITEFRNRNNIVDPSADIQGQMGLLNSMQKQLAEALIDLDLLRDATRESDPRIEQALLKIKVIESRISEERQKFGLGGTDSGEAYAVLVGQYEALTVDREFAENTYFSALASYDSAVSEAGRQSRYLAAYVKPTLAQSAQYPKRDIILGLSALFLLLVWSITVMVIYSFKDRR